jgi:hypothetical protein
MSLAENSPLRYENAIAAFKGAAAVAPAGQKAEYERLAKEAEDAADVFNAIRNIKTRCPTTCKDKEPGV